MSSTSSVESAASALGSNEPGCGQSHSARSSHSSEPCCESIGPMSPATTTSEPSPPIAWQQTELPLISFAEVSPAKTSATPAVGRASKGRVAASGPNTPGLLASLDQGLSSWRTSQRSFDEDSISFSGTWPRSGLMRSGTAFQLQPLAPRTYGTGFGSSPTHSIPTPTASDHIERKCTSTEALNFETNKSVSLDRWVKRWPTPTSRDWKDGSAKACANVPKNGLLGRVVHDGSGKPGSLNPTWVEWLMGFPLGWTALSPSEMPSSRKSRKSSGERL